MLGFNRTERSAFRKTLVRFGLLDEDWSVFAKACHQKASGLRDKSQMELMHYGSLFLCHLEELVCMNSEASSPVEVFSDGIPTEGLDAKEVLKRVTLMRVGSCAGTRALIPCCANNSYAFVRPPFSLSLSLSLSLSPSLSAAGSRQDCGVRRRTQWRFLRNYCHCCEFCVRPKWSNRRRRCCRRVERHSRKGRRHVR